MSDTIEATQGACIDFQATWTDENGDVIDLTGRTLSVPDAYPAALSGAAHTILDAANGISQVAINTAIANALYDGRRNWIRLAISDGACLKVTPKLWINVQ